MADVLLVIRVQGAKDAQDAINKINTGLGHQVGEVDKTTAATKKLNDGMGGVAAAGKNLLTSVIAPLIGFFSGTAIVKAANEYQLLENRLKLVTDGADDLSATQGRLLDISQQTGTSFANNLQVFTRFAQSAETINASNDEILQLTENINKLVVVSGAHAEEASAALIQLSQGFASGEVRGEELRSVMEQLPAVARTIADQLGLTIGQFRELSFAGKISAEDIKNALIAATSEIRERFEKMGDTASQAWGRVKNATFELVGQMNEAIGATSLLAAGLNEVAGFIGDISELVERFEFIDRITFGTVINAVEALGVAWSRFSGATGTVQDFFQRLAVDVERLAKAFDFLGADNFAAGIREFGSAVSGIIDGFGEGEQSIVDALIPPTAAEQVERRLDKAFQARLVGMAQEQLAEEKTAIRRAELAADLAEAQAKAEEKRLKAIRKAQEEALKLEEDWLSFHVSVNAAALEDLRDFWRQRLEAAEAGTRDELDALEQLAQVNEQIAEREVSTIMENTSLTKQQQQERLQAVRASLSEQAAAVEDGSQRFGLALKTVDDALADNQKEIDKTRTAVQQLADRFNDSFTTIPGAVFNAATGVRNAFRGLFEDVFTLSSSLGDALKDFFGNVADAILTNLAHVIADAAFKKLFGSFASAGGGGSGGAGVLGWIGGLLGLATGGSRVVTRPTPVLVGERGPEIASVSPLAGFRAMATGGTAMVSRPTLFMAGERGPERVHVRPVAAGRGMRAPSSSRRFSGGASTRSFAAFSGARAPVRAYAMGGSALLTKPTLVMAGERGPERATFQPVAAGNLGGGGVSVNVNAPAFFGGSLTSSALERQLGQAIFDRVSRRRTR